MSFVKYYHGIEYYDDPPGLHRRHKARFNTWVPPGAQALTVKTTWNFEEPFTEIVGGVVRPGVEAVDMIHELTHSYDFRNCRNALQCWIKWLREREQMEARAKENERRWLAGEPLLGIRFIPPDIMRDFR